MSPSDSYRVLLKLYPSDSDREIAVEAMYALSEIAYSEDGAAAVVEAGALLVLDELLESDRTRPATYQIIEYLACYRYTALALVDCNACRKIVASLG